MAEGQLHYDNPATIDARIRTHTNNQSGASERHDEYVRMADDFDTMVGRGRSLKRTPHILPLVAMCMAPGRHRGKAVEHCLSYAISYYAVLTDLIVVIHIRA